jgi:enamine deaminase RidA (YjgF/YER057c/UK114 family)
VTPTGVQAGPLVFLTAQIGRDLASGNLITRTWDLPKSAQDALLTGFEHRDGRESSIRAQTWTIYDNVEKILSSRGLGLKDVVKQRVYLTRREDEPAVLETVLARLSEVPKPATTVTTISSNGVHENVLVQIDIIAHDPRETWGEEYPADNVRTDVFTATAVDAITAPFPPAVKVGPLVFLSGMEGLDPETQQPLTRLDQLGQEVESVFKTGVGIVDRWEGPLKSQIAQIFNNMGVVLESAGADVRKNMLHMNLFLSRNLTEFAGSAFVYREWLFGDKGNAPTSTGVTVSAPGPNDAVVMVADGVASTPEWEKRPSLVPQHDMAFFPMAVRVGPFVWTTGYITMDKVNHVRISGFDQLDHGGAVGAGHLQADEDIAAQTWYVYTVINELLKEQGMSLANVVHQSVFVRDGNDYPSVALTSLPLFNGRLPATTMVTCNDIGPHKGLLLEVEVVASDL